MKNTKHGIGSGVIEYIAASTILGLPCVFSVPTLVDRTNPAVGIGLTAIVFFLLARFQAGKIESGIMIPSPRVCSLMAVLFSLTAAGSLICFFHINSLDSVDGPFPSTAVLYATYQSCTSLVFGVSLGTATILFTTNRTNKQSGRTSER